MLLRGLDAAGKEGRADQEDEGDRDLRADQHGAGVAAATSTTPATPAILERLLQGEAVGVQRRPDRCEDGGEDRQADGREGPGSSLRSR